MKKSIILFSTLALMAATAHGETLNRAGWSWSASSICQSGAGDADITGLQGMYDGDSSTCWHSNYFAASGTPERSNPHWVQIDRGQDNSEFSGLSYLPRQSTVKTACTSYYIYLSNTDMSDTPATSALDITNYLGTPTVSGSLNGDIEEKFIELGNTYTSRYILFVNVESNGSSSAACAEMNLYNGEPTGGNPNNPITSSYNAICITPMGSSVKPHRIAIQGDKLTASVVNGYVRLGNEDITVEYAMSDVARFSFEYYDFGTDSYSGSQKDIYSSRFTPEVTPAAGTITALNNVSIKIDATGFHRINSATEQPITITRNSEMLMMVDITALPDFATSGGYTFNSIGATDAGQYTLSIPEEMFILADGSRSNAVECVWTISGKDAINEIPGEVPTLMFSRSGSILTISGITGASTAELFNVGGKAIATAKADANGLAQFNVAGMPKGVYLITVNGITMKIIL